MTSSMRSINRPVWMGCRKQPVFRFFLASARCFSVKRTNKTGKTLMSDNSGKREEKPYGQGRQSYRTVIAITNQLGSSRARCGHGGIQDASQHPLDLCQRIRGGS